MVSQQQKQQQHQQRAGGHLPSTSTECAVAGRPKAVAKAAEEPRPMASLGHFHVAAEAVEHINVPTDCSCPLPASSSSLSPQKLLPQRLLFPILLLAIFATAPEAMGQNTATGKCYSFAPGLTIPGADYRRDFGLSRRQCADVCKTDLCCMAFEWRRAGGQCTLKSRSLNGTVVKVPSVEDALQEEFGAVQKKSAKNVASGDVFFALCLDYGDSERDRFWDHELGGPVVATAADVGREKCAQFCSEFTAAANRGTAEKRSSAAIGQETNNETIQKASIFSAAGHRRGKRPAGSRSVSATASTGSAVIYSWRTLNPADMEAPLGQCQCISVLQHIRLSFGSFAGFLI